MQVITDANLVDKKKWSDFVENHAQGNIFQTPEMYDLYLKTDLHDPIVIFAVKADCIKGLLLAVIQKEFDGWIGKLTSRSIIWGGPLVNDPGTADLLLFEYNKLIKRKAIYSQFRNIFPVDNLKKAFEKSGFVLNEHLNILIDLTKDEETLWIGIHKNRKKEIKKGIKKGLVVRQIKIGEENNLFEIYQQLKKLYNKIGLPIPAYSFFQNAIFILEPKGLLKTFIARVNDKLVALRMVLTYKNLIYDWYAASDDEYLGYRPNDILPWEILKWGCKNGYERFDFGGAGKPGIHYGVRDYKLKFGGDLVNFGRFEKTHNSILYILGKFGIKILSIIKK